MRTGSAITDQIAAGTLRFCRRTMPAAAERSQLDWRQETARFEQAQRQAVLDLAALYDRAFEQVGESAAAVFAVHAMLLEDEELVQSVLRLIREGGATADYAVGRTGQTFASAFEQMDSPYMKARAADIRDLARRVMRHLAGGWAEFQLDEPAILVADTFFPSEVMGFNHNLLGVISRKGSVDSHTAHLLRAYHIPALVGVDLEARWEGCRALMDCRQGVVYLDPDADLCDELRRRYQAGGHSAG